MTTDNTLTKEKQRLLEEELGIRPAIIQRVEEAEEQLAEVYGRLDAIRSYNQYKILSAFQRCRISDTHFGWYTGYGYDDPGREALERLYADLFATEAALVRPTIVSGTHALASVFLGILRPGDELIYCSGRPYDTMETIIGVRGEGQGSLRDFQVSYRQVDLTAEGGIDLAALGEAITEKTRMVSLQRSGGYAFRPAIGLEEIEAWVAFCKEKKPDILCMVDNCYGEWTQMREPTQAGVDIMAGSLIKNPGGGLALSGGYVAGKRQLVEQVSYRVTSPGIGGECGLTFGQTRALFQGLFMSPAVVNAALKTAALCARIYEELGFPVCPLPRQERSDIIQGVALGTAEGVAAFCRGIQEAAPIDGHVTPLAAAMPGYDDPVIMAAGTFVQGASIELTADAPMREPFAAYLQGALTYDHGKVGVMKSLEAVAQALNLSL